MVMSWNVGGLSHLGALNAEERAEILSHEVIGLLETWHLKTPRIPSWLEDYGIFYSEARKTI